MKDIEHNPQVIIQPRSRTEKLSSLIRRDSATVDLITRLSVLDTIIILPSGKRAKIGMEDVKKYVDRQVEYAAVHYPDGYRYMPNSEANRRRIKKIEKLFNDRNYAPLIRVFLDLSTQSWRIADRMDKRSNAMSQEEKDMAKRNYDEAVKTEEEISKKERETGKRQEHGIPPEFLEVGGESDRRESNAFLFYAAVLAKEISSSST